jgi:hypothetical protein
VSAHFKLKRTQILAQCDTWLSEASTDAGHKASLARYVADLKTELNKLGA